MKSYDIIGWTNDGEMLCPDCALNAGWNLRDDDETSPVFVDQAAEGDSCGNCLEYLDGCEPEEIE